MTAEPFDMDTVPLRSGHFRVLSAASLGQVTGAALSTLIGVMLPMIQLLTHSELTSIAQGIVACMSLVGIMVGSMIIGQWSDRHGYLFFFRLCPIIILLASLLVCLTAGVIGLAVGLFLMGFGIGGSYSLDSDYISEIMPERWKLTMVGVAKAASSLGNIAAALVCFFLLREWQDPRMWNRLILVISVLAFVMFLSRIRFSQSPSWLAARGRTAEAEQTVHRILGNDVGLVQRRKLQRPDRGKIPFSALFKGEELKRAMFCGIPWACEGFAVYGIGVFLPVLVMAVGLERSSEGAFERIVASVEMTAYINMVIPIGFVLGLLTVNRIYHVRTQMWGFVSSAAGLGLLLAAFELHWPTWAAVAGFAVFELFLNAGPHLMTFIIPQQVYPVSDRGAGAGLAAAVGKFGAVAGVLIMPQLLEWGGVGLVLGVSVAVLLVGAAVTAVVGHKVLPAR